MAEDTKDKAAAPEPPQHVKALGEMVNAASALAAIQAEANIAAMRLPERRLDDASENGGAKPYTLKSMGVVDGEESFIRVDSEGRELGKASKADVKG